MSQTINHRHIKGGEANRGIIHVGFLIKFYKSKKSDQFQISPSASTRNITAHGMKNFSLHSLLSWKMTILSILTTSLIRFS